MLNLIKSVAVVLTAALTMCFAVPRNASAISVSAESMVLIGADTLEVLASKDADKRMSMASTTKMMTALILAETGDLEKQIVTTKEMVTVEGSSMGLLEGDTVSYYALLVGMMLSSGNDAANTAAIAVAGSTEKFAELMNKRAESIGMTNTNFVTPSGLDSEEHYSTAYDMALLAAEFLKNDVLREIASSEKITVSYGAPPYKRTLYNHNKLLSRYEHAIGIKTGYTKKSGRCLVSAAERDGCTVIAVTLNAPDDWDDHEALLEYGLSSLKPVDVTCDVSRLSVSVVGSDLKTVGVTTPQYICGFSDSVHEQIQTEVYLKPFIYAPADAEVTVGRVDYVYKGKIIHSEPIVTVSEAEKSIPMQKSGFRRFLDNFKWLLDKCV